MSDPAYTKLLAPSQAVGQHSGNSHLTGGETEAEGQQEEAGGGN